MSNLNISLSTCIYAGYQDMHFTSDELIKHIKKTGYKNIEVSCWNFIEDINLKELVEKTKKEGISIPSIHCAHHYDIDMVKRDYNLLPIKKDIEAVFKEYHEKFYEDIYSSGLRNIVIVEHIPTDEKNLNFSLNRLRVLKEINKKYGFFITIENMGTKREEQLRVLERVLEEEGIYYCHDINHAAMADFDPFDFLKFFDKLKNVHVVDNQPLCPFGDGVPPGLGRLPMEDILKRMVKEGYNGLFTVEIYGFERQLKKVLEIAQSVSGNDFKTKDIDWRDEYAIYSRKYLSSALQGKRG